MQYHPPVRGSSGYPGCMIDWTYTSDSRGHMTLCTDECLADKVYDCNNESQCVCKTKGNAVLFLPCCFCILPNNEKILEFSRCIIYLDEHMDTDATQARSGKDLKIRHEDAKTEGTLMYMVELC